MKNLALTVAITIAISAFALSGCADKSGSSAAPATPWTVQKVKVIEGFSLPECVVKDPSNGDLYVSNVVSATGDCWADDANGFISRLTPDGEIDNLHWLTSTPEMPINSPKGMTIFGRRLFFNDNTWLKSTPLSGSPKAVGAQLPGAVKLNDLASNDKAMWITDTGTNFIYRMAASTGNMTNLKGPDGANGITAHNDSLYAVSWDLHDVYELDPNGKLPPQPFGLASDFTALDGIEVLDDGTFIVSDNTGNKLCAISPDRKTVRTLIELETPADFCLDRKKMLLYVPEMQANRITVLKLTR